MATFDPAQFRAAFPEFADPVAYPTPQLTFWGAFAAGQLSQDIWGASWTVGVYLYVAHEITISRQNLKSAAVKGTPGTFGGVANTKTVGKATVGYDSASTSEKDAGFWNLTTYGKQLYRLIRLFGAKVVQL